MYVTSVSLDVILEELYLMGRKDMEMSENNSGLNTWYGQLLRREREEHV